MPVWYADGTTNDQVGLNYPNGTLGARFDYLGRPRQGTTAAPTVAVASGGTAGTGAAITSHTGTDSHGNVTITTGTSASAGALVTITFSTPYTGANPPVVQIEAKDSGATALYYATCTHSVLTVNTASTTPSSTAMSFDYFVVCGA